MPARSVRDELKLSTTLTDFQNDSKLHLVGSVPASLTSCRSNHINSLRHCSRRRKAATLFVAWITLAFSLTMLAVNVLVHEDSKLLNFTHANDEQDVRDDAKLNIRTPANHRWSDLTIT